jgi:hypothetical protein
MGQTNVHLLGARLTALSTLLSHFDLDPHLREEAASGLFGWAGTMPRHCPRDRGTTGRPQKAAILCRANSLGSARWQPILSPVKGRRYPSTTPPPPDLHAEAGEPRTARAALNGAAQGRAAGPASPPPGRARRCGPTSLLRLVAQLIYNTRTARVPRSTAATE